MWTVVCGERRFWCCTTDPDGGTGGLDKAFLLRVEDGGTQRLRLPVWWTNFDILICSFGSSAIAFPFLELGLFGSRENKRENMQGWFSAQSSDSDDQLGKPASSLLADWNSYASAQSSQDTADSGLPFDIESAVRSANDTVSGTFSVVSKGVRDLPGNFQSATSNVPSGKALVYFGLLMASGVFFVFIAFTLFLPVMVVMPQKFAISFTLGCGFIIGSFFALKGPKNQLAHMLSNERLPFTLGFICSMVGTIYVSMVRHSYILSVAFSVVQVLSLGYYAISYFPGGSAGMRFLTSALTSRITKCFGS